MAGGRRRIVVDCETTAIEPSYDTGSGTIWELAAIELGGPVADAEHVWRMKPDLAKADPGALRVGRYYERTSVMHEPGRISGIADLTRFADREGRWLCWSEPGALAAHLAPMLDDATLIAANPTFDAGFLTAFLRANGQAPTWHYRLRDIGSMAWAWLQKGDPEAPEHGLPMDASTDDFAFALGIELGQFERHSALGDCRLLAAMLRVIEGGQP